MPRPNRQLSNTKVYHVIIRGINKQDIFLENQDKIKFLKILKETIEKYKYEIYAYCLMDNHVHMIIYDRTEQLSRIMQSIEVSYSFYFNKKYIRIGHLFQNRFLSKKVEDISYLMQVCRYIHRNPLKAGIDKIENYKWSSFQEYINMPKIINSKIILSIFEKNEIKAKEEFIKFHNINGNKEYYEFMEFEMEEKLTDEFLSKYICELLEISNVGEIMQFSVQKRNKILGKLKKRKEIKTAQLARVTGISRKIIERANKNNPVN